MPVCMHTHPIYQDTHLTFGHSMNLKYVSDIPNKYIRSYWIHGVEMINFFARAKYHRLGGLNIRSLFSDNSGY